MAKKKKKRKTSQVSRPPVKPAAKPMAARAEDRQSATPRGAVATKPVGRIRTFLREVRLEMKKVTWPPRKELVKSTGVVIVAVIIAAVFIGAFDQLWSVIIRAVGMGG